MWDNFIYYGKINQNRGSHKCTDGAFYKEIIVYLAVCRGTDCSGKRTKRKEYVSYKKIGNKYIVSINNHTEIVKAECFLQGERNSVGFYQRDWCYRRADPPFLQSQDKSI